VPTPHCKHSGASLFFPGIGLALAKQFLAAGDKVCFCARDADQLEAQCKELEKEYPGQTLSRATDVTKASDVAALAEFVKKEMGNVDIWINNAGKVLEVRAVLGGVIYTRLDGRCKCEGKLYTLTTGHVPTSWNSDVLWKGDDARGPGWQN
jgi:NAD(P)-dependent dehydrogenase (short-subunit alcohol dehydrogenase family)